MVVPRPRCSAVWRAPTFPPPPHLPPHPHPLPSSPHPPTGLPRRRTGRYLGAPNLNTVNDRYYRFLLLTDLLLWRMLLIIVDDCSDDVLT